MNWTEAYPPDAVRSLKNFADHLAQAPLIRFKATTGKLWLETDAQLAVTHPGKSEELHQRFVAARDSEPKLLLPTDIEFPPEILRALRVLILAQDVGLNPIPMVPSDLRRGYWADLQLAIAEYAETLEADARIPRGAAIPEGDLMSVVERLLKSHEEQRRHAFIALSTLFSCEEACFFDACEALALPHELIDHLGKQPFPKKWHLLAAAQRKHLPRLPEEKRLCFAFQKRVQFVHLSRDIREASTGPLVILDIRPTTRQLVDWASALRILLDEYYTCLVGTQLWWPSSEG